MKQIIGGILYDTEKSELVCEDSFSSGGDLRFIYEALYITPNGRWFIEYRGGAMSKYSVSVSQNTWSGSSGIRPISEDEAREFLEVNGDIETYQRFFKVDEA